MEPLISICIAAYNVESYIEACLDSVLAQNFENYEINLVDNGSTDRTVDICERYAEAFKERIRFVKLPQPTIMGRASYTALNMSRGLYSMILDSDDYLMPGALAKIAQVAYQNRPDLIMINYQCIAERGLVPRSNATFDADRINKTDYEEAVKYIVNKDGLQPFLWMFVIKNNIRGVCDVESLEGKGVVNSDAYGINYLLLKSRSIHYIDDQLYTYRLRHGSISSGPRTQSSIRDLFLSVINFINVVENTPSQFTKAEKLEIVSPLFLRYFKLALCSFDQLEEADRNLICGAFEQNCNRLNIIKLMDHYLFAKFYEYLTMFDTNEAWQRLHAYDEELLLQQSEQLRTLKIYVVPTGGYGESTARVLKNNNFEVAGFLDNSDQKKDLTIEGFKCQKPDFLRTESDLTKVGIVIASVYANHIEAIKNQLLEMGMKQEQIIIRGEVK